MCSIACGFSPVLIPDGCIVGRLLKDWRIVVYVSDIYLDPGCGGLLVTPQAATASLGSGRHFEVVYVHELSIDLCPCGDLSRPRVDLEQVLTPRVEQ